MHVSSFVSTLTGSFSTGAAGNPTVAMIADRIASGRPQLKFYEAGMDMDWSDDEEESFKIFQGKILEEYDHMVSEFGLTVIDGTLAIRAQQRQMREIVSRFLKEKLKEKVVPSK